MTEYGSAYGIHRNNNMNLSEEESLRRLGLGLGLHHDNVVGYKNNNSPYRTDHNIEELMGPDEPDNNMNDIFQSTSLNKMRKPSGEIEENDTGEDSFF